jgi:hypothetical protein
VLDAAGAALDTVAKRDGMIGTIGLGIKTPIELGKEIANLREPGEKPFDQKLADGEYGGAGRAVAATGKGIDAIPGGSSSLFSRVVRSSLKEDGVRELSDEQKKQLQQVREEKLGKTEIDRAANESNAQQAADTRNIVDGAAAMANANAKIDEAAAKANTQAGVEDLQRGLDGVHCAAAAANGASAEDGHPNSDDINRVSGAETAEEQKERKKQQDEDPAAQSAAPQDENRAAAE